MQLCALDQQNKIVFASQAKKHTDYLCLECHTVVRLRGGLHRQDHFYHLDPSRQCRQNGKSMEHLQVQRFIINALPEGEGKLEHSFPAINRIADVVWLTEKIVFEVQCSPINALEVLERNRDYAREGFQVVWILHAKRFNQYRLSAAEVVLQESPHYFTDMDIEGEGMIFDQFALYHLGRRHAQLPSIPVGISGIRRPHARSACLEVVDRRLEKWPVHFAGDLTDICLNCSMETYMEQAAQAEEEFRKMTAQKETTLGERARDWAYYLIVRPYKLFFQILLERACR